MHVLNPILAASDSAGRALPFVRSLEAALGQPHAGTILRVLAVLALGAAGVYLMLPRGQRAGKRFERYLGGALATLSLVLMVTTAVSAGMSGLEGSKLTILWPVDDQPSPTCYVFHLLAAVSLAAAIMMITSRNPVYSALWFALVLLGNSGLFLLQRAEFLSAATVIVYAGAIVVTFLFVIMLAQPTGTARYDRYSRESLLVTATGLVLASVLVGTLHYSARFERWQPQETGSYRPSEQTIAAVADSPGQNARIKERHVAGLGKSLFLDHVASVEVIGVLLLAAVVGAVLIAGHRIEDPRRN
jgi:NADH-quinone oxidoreductase subunit J